MLWGVSEWEGVEWLDGMTQWLISLRSCRLIIHFKANRHYGNAKEHNRYMPSYVIRAAQTESTIRVYQAFRPEIALPALAAGRFVPPFSRTRMTWIKPSFNWMMYRSGYGQKPGQEVVLAIDISVEGFQWALEHAVLSGFVSEIHSSWDRWRKLLSANPVRIQWDPARDWKCNEVEGQRAIQIGLSGDAVRRYVEDWTMRIEDVTAMGHQLLTHRRDRTVPRFLPDSMEIPYPLSPELQTRLCATSYCSSEPH